MNKINIYRTSEYNKGYILEGSKKVYRSIRKSVNDDGYYILYKGDVIPVKIVDVD